MAMETFDLFYEWLVRVLDYPLGWMLFLGRDLPLIILAAGTALCMLLLRRRVSDQVFLQLCDHDKQVLARRIKAARAAGDKELVKKLRAAAARVSLRFMRCEGRPLLASLLPILLLAAWAYARLGHFPPESGVAIDFSVDLDPVQDGAVVYLLPEDGVSVANGWVKLAQQAEAADGETVARAVWSLVFADDPGEYKLTVRAAGESAQMRVMVDRRRYYQPWLLFDEGLIHELRLHLPERRFLGLVPGIEKAMIPPWMLAYLLLAVPFYLLFKRLLRVY